MMNVIFAVIAVAGISLFIFFALHTKALYADAIPLYAIVQDVTIVLDERNKTATLPAVPKWAAMKDVDECVLYCESGKILYNPAGVLSPADRAFHLYAQEMVILPKEYLESTQIMLLPTQNGTAKIRFIMLKKYPYKRRY